MKSSKSFKIGKIEVCIIPPKMTIEERNQKTLDYYKDVMVWTGVALGLYQILEGLK